MRCVDRTVYDYDRIPYDSKKFLDFLERVGGRHAVSQAEREWIIPRMDLPFVVYSERTGIHQYSDEEFVKRFYTTKYRELWGENLYEMIMDLHQADRKSH